MLAALTAALLVGQPVAALAAPDNDDRDNATPVTSIPFFDMVDVRDATVEDDEPGTSCLTFYDEEYDDPTLVVSIDRGRVKTRKINQGGQERSSFRGVQASASDWWDEEMWLTEEDDWFEVPCTELGAGTVRAAVDRTGYGLHAAGCPMGTR